MELERQMELTFREIVKHRVQLIGVLFLQICRTILFYLASHLLRSGSRQAIYRHRVLSD